MNKRFLISLAVMFVLFMAFGFAVHGFILNPEYVALPNLFRAETDQVNYLPFMLLAHLVSAFAFVWLYQRVKRDGPPVGQGVCYGLAVASLMIIPKFLIYYAVQPMPGILVAKQISFDTISLMIIGVVVALLNK